MLVIHLTVAYLKSSLDRFIEIEEVNDVWYRLI